jgi:O-antigen ligase
MNQFDSTSQLPDTYNKFYRWLLSFIALVYVVASFGLTGLPGISRLALYCAVIMLFLIAPIFLKLKIPVWLTLVIFFYSYLAIPAFARELTNFNQLGTLISVLIGSISIGLAIHNKLINYKIIVYGSLIAAVINVFAIHMGIDTSHGIGQSRSAGLTGNANSLALLMLFTAYMVWLIPERFNWPIKIVAIYVALYGVVVSGSRKGLILAVILLAIIFMKHLMKLKLPQLLFFIAILATSLIASASMITDLVNKHGRDIVAVDRAFEAAEGKNRSFNSRMLMITTGFELWKDSPIFGHGFSQFRIASGYGSYAHNNYVELAVAGGCISLILFYSLHFIILKNALKQPAALRFSLITFVFAILLIDFAYVSFYSKSNLCILVFLFAIIRESDAPSLDKPSLTG